MRQSLVDLLEAAGWQAEAIARATQVAAKLDDKLPDVILSDVRMPGMTGMELLAALDKNTAPPLVLISAHGDIPMAVQAMQDGAYSFVEKPYEPRRLLSILTHAAEQCRMRQDNARLKERLIRLSGPRPHSSGADRGGRHAAAGYPGSCRYARDRADHRRNRHRQGTGGTCAA